MAGPMVVGVGSMVGGMGVGEGIAVGLIGVEVGSGVLVVGLAAVGSGVAVLDFVGADSAGGAPALPVGVGVNGSTATLTRLSPWIPLGVS